MVFDIFTMVEGFWLLLPAYAANGLVPLTKYRKNIHPIDGNRQFRGKPIFGSGKTWEGLLLGILVAMVIALVEQAAFSHLPWNLSLVHGITLNIVPMSALLGALLGLGAILGDLGGSFLKRRFSLRRGSPVPVLDQDDFVLGAFLLASLLAPIEISWVILFAILTPFFHLLASIIGYKLGIKREPW